MTSIFVAKLDFGVSNEELKEIFGQFGTVTKATIATDRETGKPRGFAFVEMPHDDEAAEAIRQLDGTEINGRRVAVKQAEDRSSNNQRPQRDNRPPREPGRDRPQRGPASGTDRPPRTDRPERSGEKELKVPVQSDFTPPASDLFPADKGTKVRREKERTEKKSDKKRAHKMEAYKKSGKSNRFFEDDDDFDEEEFDLFGRDLDDDEEDYDEEED